MRSKTYIIKGDPIPLARARHSQGKVYDSQKHIKFVWAMDLKRQHDSEPYFDGPIEMHVIFYLPLPTSRGQKKLDLIRGQWHIYKPDASNLLKFVEDVANKICYNDDCIIAKQTVEKVYDDGNGPRTEFILSELKGKRAGYIHVV